MNTRIRVENVNLSGQTWIWPNLNISCVAKCEAKTLHWSSKLKSDNAQRRLVTSCTSKLFTTEATGGLVSARAQPCIVARKKRPKHLIGGIIVWLSQRIVTFFLCVLFVWIKRQPRTGKNAFASSCFFGVNFQNHKDSGLKPSSLTEQLTCSEQTHF